METPETFRKLARFYAEQFGWRVLPVRPGTKVPALADWPRQATKDPELIEDWWSNGYAGHGIGIATGSESNLVVIDVDDGPDKFGDDTLDAWCEAHGALPETPMVLTPSGGRHFYVRWPGFNPAQDALGQWIDVQGEGRFVVAPPSVHPNGLTYCWEHSLRPSQIPVAELCPEFWPAQESPRGGGELDPRFADVLNDAGFTPGRIDSKGQQHWTRPGKPTREGTSLTVYPFPDSHATCYSPNAGLEVEHPYLPGELAKALGGVEPRAEPLRVTAPPETLWPHLSPEALIGTPKEFVELFEPVTEADTAALLLDYLVGFGNVVGPGPHVRADGVIHRANLFAMITGRSAKSRKGTARHRVQGLLDVLDVFWAGQCVQGGLSSGEGLIAAVADEELNKKGEIVAPAKDRRLLVVEEEFSRVLAVMTREGNTLSELIRQAFDSRDLRTMTKNPLSAKSPHISIIGHTTIDEVRKKLTEVDQLNGFANRFLVALVQRSHLLPDGGEPDADALRSLVESVRATLEAARRVRLVERTPDAKERWAEMYLEMADDDPPGMLGAVCARAEALTLRLSLVYALACGAKAIDVDHLDAAYAVWKFCRASAEFVFGDQIGDEVADRLLSALRIAGESGLDRTAQRQALGHNYPAARIDGAIKVLTGLGLAEERTQETGGRPRQVLFIKEER